MSSQTISLLAALIIIGGIVGYLEFQKAGPGDTGPSDVVTLTPTLEDSANETSSQGSVASPATIDTNEEKTAEKNMTTTSNSKPAAVNPTPATGSAPVAATRLSLEEKRTKYQPGKELILPDGYINTDKITLQSLVGKKVVLVDFWTYSCINCQRTLPYLNAWYDKYRDQGLEIIGVHTPEFEFERKYDNVQAAVEKFGIKYPVVLDSEYKTWTAYGNRYWPRKYLIDIDGFIVYDHIGEGSYDETERQIQKALAERALALKQVAPQGGSLVSADVGKTATTPSAGSPETYFGSWRNENLGNGTPGTSGLQTFTLPSQFNLNQLYLGGSWNIMREYAQSGEGTTRIVFRYRARDVYFVASAEHSTKVQILRDGVPVSGARGEDVSADSTTTIQQDRLYKLIHESAVGEHTLEIVIPSSGLRAFTFTFG